MARVTLDNAAWIYIEHDDIVFQFRKLDAEEGIVNFQFAKSTLGGANADRTDRYDVGGGPDEEPVPDAVMTVLNAEGYYHH